jgi:lipopolysaccharide transport system ATP-binding protein
MGSPPPFEIGPSMLSDVAIQARGLSKAYELYRNPIDRAKQFLVGRRHKYFEEFWAVRNVDIEIRRGESVGVIGCNGAGKSTLLQMVCGIVMPTSGTLTVNGKIAAMLALGAGFSPELTGRENVYIAGAVLGLPLAEIRKRFPSIVDFAGLGTFIDQPMRHYSSGMQARLSFAVSAHADADILVIDEVLAVGDAAFAAKCMRFIREFQMRGTILMVSHDIAAVANICDRVIFLDHGLIKGDGAPADVIHQYVSSTYAAMDSEGAFKAGTRHEGAAAAAGGPATLDQLKGDAAWFGIRGATITGVTFTDAQGSPLTVVRGGEQVTLRVTARSERDLVLPIVGFIVHDRLGQQVLVNNTFMTHARDPIRIASGSAFAGEFNFEMPRFKAGRYSFCVSVAEGTQDNHFQHHWIDDAVPFDVLPAEPILGVVSAPMRINRIQLLGASRAENTCTHARGELP